MGNPQKLRFSEIADLLAYLPQPERETIEYLRMLIFETLPECREKFAYSVPFYYRHSRICFLWPGSVPWGKVAEGKVALGFTQGHLLDNSMGYLEKANRKHVYTITIAAPDEVDEGLVKMYLLDALDLDQRIYRSKHPRARGFSAE